MLKQRLNTTKSLELDYCIDVGAATLFRGCTMTSSFALFMGAIQFGIFGATRQACRPVVASALGAAGSCVVSVPQEGIKQRLVTGVARGYSARGYSRF
jgi:hypothetical protein